MKLVLFLFVFLVMAASAFAQDSIVVVGNGHVWHTYRNSHLLFTLAVREQICYRYRGNPEAFTAACERRDEAVWEVQQPDDDCGEFADTVANWDPSGPYLVLSIDGEDEWQLIPVYAGCDWYPHGCHAWGRCDWLPHRHFARIEHESRFGYRDSGFHRRDVTLHDGGYRSHSSWRSPSYSRTQANAWQQRERWQPNRAEVRVPVRSYREPSSRTFAVPRVRPVMVHVREPRERHRRS